MNLANVGCGFVADYNLATAKLHPELVILDAVARLGAEGREVHLHRSEPASIAIRSSVKWRVVQPGVG